jgi:glycosyltransferase involved in cell wall biosynthesis
MRNGSGRADTVSVIVCTRDRPGQLEPALKAIQASDFCEYELVVVDQSDGDESAAIVDRIAATDSRVRLLRDRGKGASRARNAGVEVTTGDLIVFTDDDCEPRPAWLGTLVEALRAEPLVGIVFGTVLPANVDPAKGFIVGFAPARRQRLTGRLAKLHDSGIGANMAMRRMALAETGAFDEMLGPGSYFPSCEDGDMAYRVLCAGYAVLHLPEAQVVHHGLRDWRSGSALTRNTYLAVGAVYTKHARCGDIVGALLVSHQVWLAFLNVFESLVRLRGPFGFGRLCALPIGVVRSFELKVDRRRRMYQPRARQPVSAVAPQ